MKMFFIVLLLPVLMMTTGVGFAEDNTKVHVESMLISDNTWQLDYTITNISLDSFEEVTVEFDFDLFEDMFDVTGSDAGCDIQVWPAISQTNDGWAFDVLFDTSLAIGESFTGISMQVDYLGVGEPVMQYYEVVDPGTFQTIADGYTVPEPATLMLLALGGLLTKRKRL